MTISEVTVVEDTNTIEITEQSAGTVEVTDSEQPTVEISQEDTTVEVTASPETVVVTERESHTVEVDEPSHVIVHTAGIGSGIGGFYNQQELLALLDGALTYDQFIPGMEFDLYQLTDFWQRVGGQAAVLWTEDYDEITTSYQTYTDTEISSVVIRVDANEAGIDLNATSIVQTNTRIDLQAVDIESNGDDISIQSATLSIHAGQIATNVSDITVLNGITSSQQTSITQNASDITIQAIDIQSNEDATITNEAAIVVNADQITNYVTQLNENTGEINSLNIELTAVSATTTINQSSIAGTQAEVESVQTQLADYWGVKITEVNGVEYITSMGLTLHTDWITATPNYYVGDYVAFWDAGDIKIYRCILDHGPADADNSPTGINGALYWVHEPDGKKSTFRVDAEQFEIYNAQHGTPGEEDQPLFVVNGDAVILGYSVDLQSSGYDTGSPGYKLSASNGTAEFRDMRMTFSSGDPGDDAEQDVRNDINSYQMFRSTPTTPYVVGDLWDRGATLGIYVCQTSRTAAQSHSSAYWVKRGDTTSNNTAAFINGQGDLATKDTIDWDGSDIDNQPQDADILNANQLWAELDGDQYFDITASGLLLKDTAAQIVLGKTGADGGTIFTKDKTSYDDATNGFFLGWDATAGAYTFGIGVGSLDSDPLGVEWDGSVFTVYGKVVGTLNVADNNIVQISSHVAGYSNVLSSTTTWLPITTAPGIVVPTYNVASAPHVHIYGTVWAMSNSSSADATMSIELRRGASWATGTVIGERAERRVAEQGYPGGTAGDFGFTVKWTDISPVENTTNYYWLGVKKQNNSSNNVVMTRMELTATVRPMTDE